MLKEVDIDIFLVYLLQQSRIEQEMSCRLSLSYIIVALKKIQKVYMKRPNIYSFLRPF